MTGLSQSIFVGCWRVTMMYLPMSCPKSYRQGEKNDFAQQEIEFLGHVVTNDRIKLNMRKIKAIKEWKRPSTHNDLGYSLA